MTRAARARPLLSLQADLLKRRSAPERKDLVLPFQIGGARFALPYGQVTRVMVPAGVAAVARCDGLPLAVVGVCASDTEMLTVIDAGLLISSVPIEINLKTRLLLLSSKATAGFALLVSRVLDPIEAADAAACSDIRAVTAEQIGEALKRASRFQKGQ